MKILRTAAATLSHVFYTPGTETATDPTGTPTYAVVDAAGGAVTSGNATVIGGGTGQVTAALAGQAQLGRLTVTWTGTVAGASLTETEVVDVVGGFFFTLAEARNSDVSLADTQKYTTDALAWARDATEAECELICDRSFVPRYVRQTLDGTGTSSLVLQGPGEDRSFRDFRTLRSLAVAPQVDETFVAFSTAELADVAVEFDGTMHRASGDIFTGGWRNVQAAYEYGLDAPIPADLKEAALIRFRTWLNLRRSGIPDRVTSYTAVDGGSYRLALPGAYATGIPDVDAVYSRYSRRMRSGTQAMGGGPVPAGRTYSYNPQAYSLFHGKGGWPF